jgi:hypothetical protein
MSIPADREGELPFTGKPNVLDLSDYSIGEGYVFCGSNVEPAGKITYFPIYMLMFLQKKELPEDILFETDFSDLQDLPQ